VDLVVTSPPYYQLRAYATGGHPAEVGSEPHWRDWLARLVEATAEMARVLKPSGSIFVNLGDKYNSAAGAGNTRVFRPGHGSPKWADDPQARGGSAPGIPEKSLMLLPERYRIACVDQLGLTARAVICWHKVNGLPESVRDRVRRSHEDWVHLTRGPRYYAATDELREPHATPLHNPGNRNGDRKAVGPQDRGGHSQWEDTWRVWGNSLGKLPGSVWSIPSEPLRLPAWLGVDHYASFPSEWPRRLVLGWSPPGVCVVCGQGRWPVVERQTNAEAWRDLPLKPGEIGRLAARPRDTDPETDAKASGLSRPGWREHPPRQTHLRRRHRRPRPGPAAGQRGRAAARHRAAGRHRPRRSCRPRPRRRRQRAARDPGGAGPEPPGRTVRLPSRHLRLQT
jgi:DNA modification methylase